MLTQRVKQQVPLHETGLELNPANKNISFNKKDFSYCLVSFFYYFGFRAIRKTGLRFFRRALSSQKDFSRYKLCICMPAFSGQILKARTIKWQEATLKFDDKKSMYLQTSVCRDMLGTVRIPPDCNLRTHHTALMTKIIRKH